MSQLTRNGIIVIGLVAIAAIISVYVFTPSAQEISVSSFEECAEHYPVMESYPRQCRTPDGELYVESIERDWAEGIAVSVPQPNARVSSPLEISGEARGAWFFEGSFDARLMLDGELLAGEPVSTSEDRATDSLAPFRGTLSFSVPRETEATLVLSAADPSGRAENAKQVSIPITLLPSDDDTSTGTN